MIRSFLQHDIPDSEEVSKIAHEKIKPKLNQIVDHIGNYNHRIDVLDKPVQEYMTEYESAINAIAEIPGTVRCSAEVFFTEIGIAMSRFPSATHLCSWAGVCPRNYQRTGRRKTFCALL